MDSWSLILPGARVPGKTSVASAVAPPGLGIIRRMPAFSITTLGCKVNQYDSRAIAAALEAEGLTPLPPATPRTADLLVVNTCCVTAAAMRKSRQAIRRAVRRAPDAAVLVVGCYGDYDSARLWQVLRECRVRLERAVIVGHHDDLAAHVQRVAGRLASDGSAANSPPSGDGPAGGGDAPPRPGGRRADVRNDVRMIAAAGAGPSAAAPRRHARIRTRRQGAVKLKRSAVSSGAPPQDAAREPNGAGTRGLPPAGSFPGHQRAFVKVQDGCDAFCAYCVVPYARRRVWWRPMHAVVAQCRALVAAGHREIVLCGVFLGAYGRDTTIRRRWGGGPARLPELVRRVADIEGLWRVRLSSLEPGDVTEELIDACRAPGVAPHFHLPLQSGSPAVLRRMNRQYTADDYRRAVDLLREAFDRPAITTDIIVGFPGEGEVEFRQTLAAARHAGVAKIHAFPFSAIAGTAAWTYRREAAPPAVRKRRSGELAALERELAAAYRARLVGEKLEGLVEAGRGARHQRRAMTGRYQTVFFSGGARPGDVVRLRVTGVREDGLAGRLASE